MLLSQSVPEDALENLETKSFLDVLDNLHLYKQEKIAEYVRSTNYALPTDKRVLTRNLQDYGVKIPYELPVPILQQFLLNVDTIMAYKGSLLGLELLCNVLTFGEVTIDADVTHFCELLYLDTPESFIGADTELQDYYLCTDSDEIAPLNTIDISINTPYAREGYEQELAVIQSALSTAIVDFLGFFNVQVAFTWDERNAPYFHEQLNSYFV